jgi:hypothetical protein
MRTCALVRRRALDRSSTSCLPAKVTGLVGVLGVAASGRILEKDCVTDSNGAR